MVMVNVSLIELGQKYPMESVLRFRWMCVQIARSSPWQPKNWLCTTERIKIQIDIISNQVAIYTALANSELLFLDIFQGVTQTLCQTTESIAVRVSVCVCVYCERWMDHRSDTHPSGQQAYHRLVYTEHARRYTLAHTSNVLSSAII